MIFSWPFEVRFLYEKFMFLLHMPTEIFQILEFASALFMATFKGLENAFPVLTALRKPVMSPEARKGQTVLYTI